MICARCGKETKEFYNNLCLDCYIETLPPTKVKIRKCKVCKKYFVSKKIFNNLEEALDFYLKKFVRKKITEIEIPKEKIILEEKEFICPNCKKEISKKIEAILQIRGDKKPVDEIVKIFDLNAEKVENGYDIKFFSKDLLKKIVKEIKKRYFYEEKISRKLIGLKEGKRKYKDTVLIRVYGKKG